MAMSPVRSPNASIARPSIEFLDFESVVLVETPIIILNRTNIQAQIERRCGRRLGAKSLNKNLDDIQCLVTRETQGIGDRVDIDAALCSVFRSVGLVYQETMRVPPPIEIQERQLRDTTRARRTEELSHEVNGVQTMLAPALRRMPTGRITRSSAGLDQVSDVVSNTVSLPANAVNPAANETMKRTTSLKSKRPSKRPALNEQSDVSPSDRFCQNIGRWFASLFGHNPDTRHLAVEALAGNLFTVPADHDGVSSTERKALEPSEPRRGTFKATAYRYLRGQILIGLALTYEHNLRGDHLVRNGVVHPACRPTMEEPFRYSNLGVCQAQMFAYGTDVNRSSGAYRALRKAGFILPDEQVPKARGRSLYQRVVALELHWPASERRRLYAHLTSWYHGKNLQHDLVFVIDLSTDNTATGIATETSSAVDEIGDEAGPTPETTARTTFEVQKASDKAE